MLLKNFVAAYQSLGQACAISGFLTEFVCFETEVSRYPGSVYKKLDTRQSEILPNFLEIVGLIPLRTEDICLEISSDCKYCLGLKVEATVELGHRVKSQSFRHLENIQVLTH